MAWSDEQHEEVLKALAVVCEVTGCNFSNPAKQFLLSELETYSALEVLVALKRCAREVTHKLALAHVIERIEEEREKNKAKRRALDSAEETRLRIAALDAQIPWEIGKEKVREMLEKIGKGLPTHDEPKEQSRERAKMLAKHWSETEED